MVNFNKHSLPMIRNWRAVVAHRRAWRTYAD